jgi:hypothetical protein
MTMNIESQPKTSTTHLQILDPAHPAIQNSPVQTPMDGPDPPSGRVADAKP